MKSTAYCANSILDPCQIAPLNESVRRDIAHNQGLFAAIRICVNLSICDVEGR